MKTLLRGIRTLVMGAATAVAVAWLAPLFPTALPPPPRPFGFAVLDPSTDFFRVSLGSGNAGLDRVILSRVGPAADAAHAPRRADLGPWMGEWAREHPVTTRHTTGPAQHIVLQQQGWPFPALSGSTAYAGRVNALPTAANELTPHWMIRLRPFYHLACKPVFPGLVLNGLIFGVLWDIPLVWLPLLVRRRRVARGLCPRCRYDLQGQQGSGCPECGWNRATAPGRAA
ncbi:MAG: hypothetical protein AAF235_07560 [Planctomycetota bacterium]